MTQPWIIRVASERDTEVLARTHRLTATYAFASIFPPEAPVPPADDVEYAVDLG